MVQRLSFDAQTGSASVLCNGMIQNGLHAKSDLNPGKYLWDANFSNTHGQNV